jgi:hypothetical protein
MAAHHALVAAHSIQQYLDACDVAQVDEEM